MDLVFCITNDSWDINKIKGNGMKSKIRYIFLLVPISIIVFFAYVISQSQNKASQPLNLELPEFQLQPLDNKTLSEKIFPLAFILLMFGQVGALPAELSIHF